MLIVDVETTGTEPEKHSIVSIGAIDFHNIKPHFYQECRIWEGAEFSLEALNVNGFSTIEIVHPKKENT